DDLLEAEQVGLQRGHVGQEQRQALETAVGEVTHLERAEVYSVHRSSQAGGGAMGRENEKVLPTPSVDSTQMRPPCCSMMWRGEAGARPRPPLRPRTRARSHPQNS